MTIPRLVSDNPTEPDQAWRGELLLERGQIVDCRENVATVLENHPAWKGALGIDQFAKRIVVRR